jgi:hypothetical protein
MVEQFITDGEIAVVILETFELPDTLKFFGSTHLLNICKVGYVLECDAM